MKIIGPPNTFNVLPQLRTDFSKLLKDAPLPAAQGTQAFIPSSTLTLTAPLRGTVVDLLGRRMESVRIQVLSLDTGKAGSLCLTNWDGAFEVQETPGSYVVVAHRDNFKDATATATLTIGMAVPVALTMMTAPSFNCGKAATRVEKLICSEPELTDDETAMAAAFNHLLSTLDSAELTTVRREHGDWFRRYSASCNSRPIEEMKRCVASELRSRARQLRYTSTGRR